MRAVSRPAPARLALLGRLLDDAGVLARLPLLEPAECDDIWQRVAAHEARWTPRHADLPSFTLGAAAYLDVPRQGVATYLVRAVRNNKLLRREFADLLERTQATLQSHLGAPVEVTRRFAVPGFHVFRHHPRMHELEPRVHFDLQQHRLDFPEDDAVDPAKVFSFTVAIAIPEAGAGLYIWPRALTDVPDHSPQALKTVGREVEPEFHGYRLGELFVHDGGHLHAIAADRVAAPGEVRVTYQGHGIFTGGAWQIYW